MIASITSVLASMLLASSTQTLTQAQLQPARLSEPIVQAVKERKVRIVEFGDQSFEVGDLVVGALLDESVTVPLQRFINAGGIGQAWNALDVNDGKVTHLSGHNPGVFSNFANWVQVGKTITVHDVNGVARTYRINRVMETPMNHFANGVSADVTDYMFNHMYDHEAILIQFCRPERYVMQVWEAVPV